MRNDRRPRVFVLLCILSAVSFSCGVKSPVATRPATNDAELIRAISLRAVAFTAEGKLRLSGLSPAFAECRLSVDPKAGMRIEIFSPFMTPVATMVVVGDRMEYFNAQERLIVRGKSDELLRRLFDLPADPSMLPWILGGGIPPDGAWSSQKPGPQEPKHSFILSSRSEGRVVRAVFEDETYRLTSLRRFQEDGGVQKDETVIECSDHLQGVSPVPRKVVLRSPLKDQDLILRLDSVELGRGPQPEDLRIKSVPGVDETNL